MNMGARFLAWVRRLRLVPKDVKHPLPRDVLPPPKPDDRNWQRDFQNKMSEGYHSSGKIKPVR